MAAFGVTLSLTEKTPQQIIAYLVCGYLSGSSGAESL